MVQITLTKESYTKKQGTKTVFNLVETEQEVITEREYNNIVNSAPFFRRLGASVTQERTYTCNGYKVVKDTSTSPNRESKTVRKFKFTWID